MRRRPFKLILPVALLSMLPWGHAVAGVQEDLTAIPIEDPRLFEGIRGTILQSGVSGLAKAQRPLEKVLDEAIYLAMKVKYKGRIYDASPQMNGVLMELAGAVDDSPAYPWKLLYVDDPGLKFFSTSFGRIYVSAGMLNQGLTEADLAGILAHEMAHVLRHHMIRRFKFAVGSAATAATGVSIVLQSPIGAHAPAVMPLAFLAEYLVALQMNRDEETEADEFAMTMLQRSSFGCPALPRVLEKLAKLGSGASAGGILKYLQSHPPASERIARAQRRCMA